MEAVHTKLKDSNLNSKLSSYILLTSNSFRCVQIANNLGEASSTQTQMSKVLHLKPNPKKEFQND